MTVSNYSFYLTCLMWNSERRDSLLLFMKVGIYFILCISGVYRDMIFFTMLLCY